MKSESLIQPSYRSAGLHLGLDLLDDVAFLDDVVLDLDAGDFLEGLGKRLRFIFVHGQGFGDRVDLIPLKGAALMNHAVLSTGLPWTRRGLKLGVDPLFRGSLIA